MIDNPVPRPYVRKKKKTSGKLQQNTPPKKGREKGRRFLFFIFYLWHLPCCSTHIRFNSVCAPKGLSKFVDGRIHRMILGGFLDWPCNTTCNTIGPFWWVQRPPWLSRGVLGGYRGSTDAYDAHLPIAGEYDSTGCFCAPNSPRIPQQP